MLRFSFRVSGAGRDGKGQDQSKGTAGGCCMRQAGEMVAPFAAAVPVGKERADRLVGPSPP